MSLGAATFLVLLVGKLGFGWDLTWFTVFLPLIIELVLDVLAVIVVVLLGKRVAKRVGGSTVSLRDFNWRR